MSLKRNYELCVLLCSILGWNVWWKPASTLNKTPHWKLWPSNNRLDFWLTYLPPPSQMPSNLDFHIWNECIYIVWVNMLISLSPLLQQLSIHILTNMKPPLGFIPPLGFESSHRFRTLPLCSAPVSWPLLRSPVALTLTSPGIPCLSPHLSRGSQHCGLWINDLFRLLRLSSQTGPAQLLY